MDYLNTIEEMIRSFEYWEQAAFVICGVLLGYWLRIVTLKLRILRLSKNATGRNMVLIEPQIRGANSKKVNRIKREENARYFEQIKSAQYSPEEWQKTKNKGWE